jgi:hypothetical protein
LKDEFLNENFDINFTQIGQTLNFKQKSTSYKFLKLEHQSSSFFINNLQFFCLNIPLVVLTFLALKILFKVFFNNWISLLIREYSFNLFIFVMLMEGNLESFAYFLMYDLRELNSLDYFQKKISVLTVFFSVLFFWYTFLYYFIIKIVEKDNARYFFDNYHTNNYSMALMSSQINVFSYFLGMCHIMLDKSYSSQLIVLFLLEICYILMGIHSISKKVKLLVYGYKCFEWQNIFASGLRICLILSFGLDRDSTGVIRSVFDEIQIIIIILYLANWILCMAINIFLLVSSITKKVRNRFCS